MVPFISWLIIRKRPEIKTFFSVVLGFIGVSILTRVFETDIEFNLGDLLCLLSAVCFAAQIAYTEFVEIASTAVFSVIYLLIFENEFQARYNYHPKVCWPACIWAQSVAQKHIAS